MRRVSGHGLIGPRTTYLWPWIRSTPVNTFCFRTTSSEFFIFSHHLPIYMCIYNQYFSYIYVYETASTGSCYVSRLIDAEWWCTILWGSKTKISRPHKHHAKDMDSLHQKTYRNHVNTMQSWIQPWLSSMNTYRTSTVISLNNMNIS